MGIVKAMALLIGGLILGHLLFALGVVDWVDRLPGTEGEPYFAVPTYLSFVAALLTAVTAALTALAIGIGVVAAYTISSIKADARTAARDEVQKLTSTEAIKAHVKESVAQIAYGESRGLEDLDDDVR
ncbi:MAG: hypothetical protein OXC91_15385 [Rhodobacteraceae bacterium]|nr:hypothetical protein [Paracoccaceae bacterium]